MISSSLLKCQVILANDILEKIISFLFRPFVIRAYKSWNSYLYENSCISIKILTHLLLSRIVASAYKSWHFLESIQSCCQSQWQSWWRHRWQSWWICHSYSKICHFWTPSFGREAFDSVEPLHGYWPYLLWCFLSDQVSKNIFGMMYQSHWLKKNLSIWI